MPAQFGKYTLIRRLAVGGMAELYLALQRSVAGFEKLIVVKRVLPHLVTDESFIQMLLAEARIAATLNHPNIAHVYDVGEVDGQYYIAMEHVHGEDLRSLVRQMKSKGATSFPLENALAIVLGCCAGLAYAHEKRDLDGEPMGIVHRDVSPQNVVVTFTGDVKLVDFGIALVSSSEVEDTEGGQIKGKVPYMSPEQAKGDELDSRSDIFSLGIMLFELTTGRRLFRSKSEMETLRRIVEEEYPKPRELNPSLSPRLEEIILRSLEKDRDLRYGSAREMQADLEDYIRSEQLKVSSLSLGEWMQKLFEEKLEAQKRLLQEGRQLADILADQAGVDDREGSLSGGSRGSRVRPKSASRARWLLLAAVLLAAGVAGAFFALIPEPEPPAAPVGTIAVFSTPPGAAIWIDGDRRPERTPAELTDLPIGASYNVKLTHDGFASYTERVDLTAPDTRRELTVTLEQPTASDFAVVRVRTMPPGAQVLLDGRDTGQVTPATIPEVTPGERHTLALALEGFTTRTERLSLERGQVAELSFELTRTPLGPNEALLRVVTDPPTARVRIDGVWHEAGSPYEFRIPARRYRVTVSQDEFLSEERQITVRGGETLDLEVELRPRPRRGRGSSPSRAEVETPSSIEPGRLTFSSRPWCNVTVDGRNAGQTPVVNFEVPTGRHTVVCENPQVGSRQLVITVPPGQTVRRAITLE